MYCGTRTILHRGSRYEVEVDERRGGEEHLERRSRGGGLHEKRW